MRSFINTIKLTALLLITFAAAQKANAQLNPMGALYFQNQYLANPALAGSTAGLNLNLGYRKQWTSIPGSPSIQTLTGDYALNDKVGLGLNIYNDKAGLFKRTRTVASYAYHLPLNGEDEKLSFGLSLGFMSERISDEDVHGDAGDVNVGTYNQRSAYIDGDFGAAYTSGKFSVQAALPNMKSFFKKDMVSNSVDRSTFFSAVSYKMQLTEGNSGIGMEPKVCYRGVKGFDNILDAGVNLNYANNRVSLFGMYHSSQSTTFGLGLNYQSIGVSGMYSTATSALSGYANGNFEVNLLINLKK
jgi:type IX secretion system PorP/SprF family membrane protein